MTNMVGKPKIGFAWPNNARLVVAVTCALTTSDSRPVFWSILKAVMSPQVVTDLPSASAQLSVLEGATSSGASWSRTYRKLPEASANMRKGLMP